MRLRHNSPAELPRSTARIQIPRNLAIIVVNGVMASVRCHRSEQLNVQHMDMSANTATNATTSSPYVAAGQLGERREDSKDNPGAAFQSLCGVTELFSTLYSVTILDQNPGRRAIALDHHIYDQLSNMWLRRSSEPQPYTMLTVTPIGEDYADLGCPLKSKTRSSILPSMADTE